MKTTDNGDGTYTHEFDTQNIFQDMARMFVGADGGMSNSTAYEWHFTVSDPHFKDVTWDVERVGEMETGSLATVNSFERRKFGSEVSITSYGATLAEALEAAKEAYKRDVPEDVKAALWR